MLAAWAEKANQSDAESGPAADERAIARLAARQHGVVTLAQLRELGLGPRAVQRRAEAGRLHRVHRVVYAVGHAAVSPDGRRLAAVLACGPGALLSHGSAAALWGFRPTAAARFDVTVPRSGRAAPAVIRLHRPRRLADGDRAVVRGIPLTSVARTLVDLARILLDDALARAVHEAEVLRLLDVAAIVDPPVRLRRALAQPGGATRSELERRFARLCRDAGLPPPRINATLHGFEVDALWPEARLVVELDGAAAHLTRRAFEEDRRRDAVLAGHGYTVVRLTWRRLTEDGAAVAQLLSRMTSGMRRVV